MIMREIFCIANDDFQAILQKNIYFIEYHCQKKTILRNVLRNLEMLP